MRIQGVWVVGICLLILGSEGGWISFNGTERWEWLSGGGGERLRYSDLREFSLYFSSSGERRSISKFGI